MDISTLLKLKNAWSSFSADHPRFPDFLRDVKKHGLTAGMEVTLTVSYPDGENLKAGLKLTENDLELLQALYKLKE